VTCVTECQNILDFAATKNDGSSTGNYQNSNKNGQIICTSLHSDHHQQYNTTKVFFGYVCSVSKKYPTLLLFEAANTITAGLQDNLGKLYTKMPNHSRFFSSKRR